MYIAGQFQEVWLVLTQNRPVAVLEEVSEALVPVIEIHHIAG